MDPDAEEASGNAIKLPAFVYIIDVHIIFQWHEILKFSEAFSFFFMCLVSWKVVSLQHQSNRKETNIHALSQKIKN